MIEDKLLRIGLIASVVLNGSAITFVGYAGTLRPKPAVHAAIEKPKTSRLVEINMLAEEKASAEKEKGSDKGRAEAGSGDGGASGSLSDGNKGPLGKLNKGALAKEAEPKPPAQPIVPPLVRKPKLEGARKPVLAASGRAKAHRNTNVALHPKLTLDLGTLRLKRPAPQVTGGYHGIVDLRNLKLKGDLVAMNPKAGGPLKPNKVIGKSHIKIVGKPTPGGAVCVPTGGNTIYASDLTILLGKDTKLDGTKFCLPGGLPGIPGGSGESQASSSKAKAAGQTGAQGSGGGATKPSYGAEVTSAHKPLHEGNGPASLDIAQGQGKLGGGTAGKGARHGDPDAATGSSDYKGQASTAGTTRHEIIDTGSQQALQDRYERYASGPLRGINDAPGMGGGGAATRALHLPAFHNDPTDRIPGALVPQDQRKLVDSPKAHRGSSAAKGSSSEKEPRRKRFDLSPSSVGSHSSQGTVLWPADAVKSHKRKASRRVKGDGKKDGGGDGSGLLGEYFRGMDFEKEIFRRPDRNIDFDWSSTIVDRRMPVTQNFSVRWTGFIRPRYSDVYTIYAASDDGDRVWINGQLVISNWTTHGATEDVARIPFIAGQKYSIKVEYFENDVPPAVMRLYWESPRQRKEYVPQSCLFYPTQK